MRGGVAPIAIVVGLIAVVSGWIVRPSEQASREAASTSPIAWSAGCAQQVVRDWYDDGRLDRRYARRCYDEALAALPTSSPGRGAADARDAIRGARDDAAANR